MELKTKKYPLTKLQKAYIQNFVNLFEDRNIMLSIKRNEILKYHLIFLLDVLDNELLKYIDLK